MENSEKDTKYFRAKERVRCVKKFYTSLLSYVVVISLLGAFNYYLDQWRHPWFLWAAFGWGIGLVFMAAKAYNLNPFFGKDWEQRKLIEFMEEDEKQNRWK